MCSYVNVRISKLVEAENPIQLITTVISRLNTIKLVIMLQL